MASSRKTSVPHTQLFSVPRVTEPLGNCLWIIQNQLSIKWIIFRHIPLRHNSLNVTCAIGATHSTYVFSVLLGAPGSASLQVLWTLLVHRIVGLCSGVLQLPARLCSSVYSPSHSGQYYMGHNSTIYNNNSSKSDSFSPWTLEYLLWSTKGWGSVLLENMQPSPSDCDQFFSSGLKEEERLCPQGNQAFIFP